MLSGTGSAVDVVSFTTRATQGEVRRYCQNTGGKVLDEDSTSCASNPSLPLLTVLFSISASPEEDVPEGSPL